jgi:hypothetical protein
MTAVSAKSTQVAGVIATARASLTRAGVKPPEHARGRDACRTRLGKWGWKRLKHLRGDGGGYAHPRRRPVVVGLWDVLTYWSGRAVEERQAGG